MQVTAGTGWTGAMMTSLTGAPALCFAAIPRVVVILVIGWIIAALFQMAVRALLNAVKFNGLIQRAGFAGLTQMLGVKTDLSGFLATGPYPCRSALCPSVLPRELEGPHRRTLEVAGSCHLILCERPCHPF